MPLQSPIGMSDFRQLRHQSATYVDKTAAVVELLAQSTEVLLFTRPRRFGKTLFLTTLQAFLQQPDHLGEDTTELFTDLAVWQSGAARAHHQQYPVVLISFKDVKATRWEAMLAEIAAVLSAALTPCLFPLIHPEFDQATAGRLSAVQRQQASPSVLEHALVDLISELHRVTGRQVVVLIDEYDTPLHAAWLHGFYEDATQFFRSFLARALKDQPFLFKAVLTGILRVARESLFSGLNHMKVYSVLGTAYQETFGFTEVEVAQLATLAGVPEHVDGMRAWYDGYRIGSSRLYNPWSVLSFLQLPEDGLQPYWVNTGGTDLIEKLLQRADVETRNDVQTLISGQTITRDVDESLIFPDLDRPAGAIWSLLLAAGYLKPVEARLARGRWEVELAIPNHEVGLSWRLMSTRWIEHHLGQRQVVDLMLAALFAGDQPAFSSYLQRMASSALSFHDTGGQEPERVWQAFILGLLVHLEPTYEVRSNLETGYGRADVLIRPRQPGLPAAVIELKRIEPGEDASAALDAALHQIEHRNYAASLREGSPTSIQLVGAVFEGKRVHVRMRGA